MSRRRSKGPLEDAEAGEIADRLRLDGGVAFMARVLSARANSLFQELTGQDEITPRQFGVLLTLHQRGPLTLTQLAEAIEVDRSTLSEMIRRMGDRGLLARSGNASDRRSAKVSITPQGQASLLALVSGAARLQTVLLSALPADQRLPFVRAMKAITRSSTP